MTALSGNLVGLMVIAGLIVLAFIIVLAFLFFETHPKRNEGLDAPISKAAVRRILEQEKQKDASQRTSSSDRPGDGRGPIR